MEFHREKGERKGSGETLAAARERFERSHIMDILNQTRWSKTMAAKVLGLSRKALWEKCKRYGIMTADEPPENGSS